ncbi:MAG: hypothetical protein HY908_26580 [Myxococcales bacterium]|nr:hypothetical protein [Myxococcales bacterium]
MVLHPQGGREALLSAGRRYQPFYCEENAYWLCQDEALGSEREVVFVSNDARSVAMWHQLAAPPGEPLVWDYHVLVLSRAADGAGKTTLAWDLDTRLACPVPAASYLGRCFRPTEARYRPRFRVVPAAHFAALFSTDRAHMRAADGTWLKPPPPWPAPGLAQRPPNLAAFVDCRAPFAGELYDLPSLVARVSAPR